MKRIDNIYIINLDKDKSRYNSALTECKKITNKDPIRISGVYGKELKNEDMKEHVDYIYSKIGLKSAIGCAMSHIKAWETMLKNKDTSSLFLEDDISIDKDFVEKYRNIDIPDDYYIIYLGCTTGCDIDKKYNIEFPLAKLFIGKNKYSKKVIKLNDKVYIPSLPLALHGYILSRKGAEYLLNRITQDKIKFHIDAQILKYLHTVPSYAVSPQLIYQQNVNLETSNNIGSQFPILFNKLLSSNDRYNIPINYKINIGMYQIGNYIINSITFLMIILGASIGFMKIPINYVLIGIVIFIFFEIKEMKNINKKIDNIFIVNLLVSIILILSVYYMTFLF